MAIVLHRSGAQFETKMELGSFAENLDLHVHTLLHLPEHGLMFPFSEVVAIAEDEEALRKITRR